jgi:membrane protease YdiL (CAAX protease family)
MLGVRRLILKPIFVVGCSFNGYLNLNVGGAFVAIAVLHALQLLWLTTGNTSSFSTLMRCGHVGSAVWTPIVEELIFRYIVFNVVLQRSGGNLSFAVLTSSCLFGALHLQGLWQGSLTIFSCVTALTGLVVGLVYTLLFATTGSLPSVVMLHILNNAVAIAWLSRSSTCSQEIDTALAGNLLLQLFLTMGCSWYLWASLQRQIANGSFKKIHPLVYGA